MTTSCEDDSRALAQTYDRVSGLQLERGKRLAERLGLDEGARVLDVGCGTGRLADWLAECVGTSGAVVAIDPVQERIDLARSRGGAVRFEVGQAEDLGAFEDASFDAVCMSSVLHWVADKARALAEVRRVLRPGGRLGVTTSVQELARDGTVRLVLDPLLAREPYAGRVETSRITAAPRPCTTTEIIQLVLESGLALVELQVTSDTQMHASGEDLVQFVEASASGTFLRNLTDDLRPLLRADLVAALDAQRGLDGVALRSWSVLFTATRD